jgi:hypothetical protein
MTYLRTVLLALVFGAVAGMCQNCTQPQPGPAPVPTPVADAAPPSDRFTAKVFDCHLDVVAVERDSATSDVAYCLSGSSTFSCLLGMGQYNDATVACLARDLGAKANANVLAGSADPADKAKADGSQWWITIEQLGYK